MFKRGEIRVGKIEKVEIVAESEKLYKEVVNLGKQQRIIFSGLRPYVPLQKMTGLVLVFCNLKPKKILGD